MLPSLIVFLFQLAESMTSLALILGQGEAILALALVHGAELWVWQLIVEGLAP